MASILRGRGAKEASRSLYRAASAESRASISSRGAGGGRGMLRSAREADPRANCEHKSFTRTIRSADEARMIENPCEISASSCDKNVTEIPLNVRDELA